MHEHLDDFAFINMNGRCYDPMLARFLSPDPHIQSPDDALNYNRFAYCMNNPFLFTDPSGYNWFSNLWDWFKKHKQVVVIVTTIVVAVAVTVVTWGAGAPLLMAAAYGSAAGGFAGGVFGGALDGNSIGDCIMSGIGQAAIGFVAG